MVALIKKKKWLLVLGFLMEGHIYFMLTTLAYGAEGLHINAFIKVGIGYQIAQVWNLKH